MRFLLAALMILMVSCKDKVTEDSASFKDNTPIIYKPLIVKRICTIASGHEVQGYTHYLTVENYNEDGFDNFLVDYADRYRDTCKANLPVWHVTFCEPFNFVSHSSSEDDKLLRQHSIVTIGYQEETLHKKLPDIGSVIFYKNGKPIYIQTMTLDRMKNDSKYYKNGFYDRSWIKDFDKKFDTHYSDEPRK